MTKSESSERCLVGIATHLARASAEVQKALAFSMEEGSECTEEKLCEILVAIEQAATLNMTCGRVWDNEL